MTSRTRCRGGRGFHSGRAREGGNVDERRKHFDAILLQAHARELRDVDGIDTQHGIRLPHGTHGLRVPECPRPLLLHRRHKGAVQQELNWVAGQMHVLQQRIQHAVGAENRFPR